MPSPLDAPARCSSQISGCGGRVLQAVFGDQALVGLEGPGFTGQFNALLATTHEGHFDALLRLLPHRLVGKALRINRSLQIPVEPGEQIAGEGGGHACGIVVGGFEGGGIAG